MSIQRIIFLLVVVICISCQKYEEDEFISLKSAKKRILGDWKLKSLVIDGNDSTQAAKDLICDNYIRFLDEKGSFGGTNVVLGYQEKCSTQVFRDGFYVFANKKTELILGMENHSITSNYVGAFLTFDTVWEIVKLTSKEMKLTAQRNNQLNEVEFKK